MTVGVTLNDEVKSHISSGSRKFAIIGMNDGEHDNISEQTGRTLIAVLQFTSVRLKSTFVT